MKQKHCLILLILIVFTHSLLAGGPSKRLGSIIGTAEALAQAYGYLMHGAIEFSDPEGDDDDGDDGETQLEEEAEDPEDLLPIYLLGENRDHTTDLAFQALMIRLAFE